MKQEPLYTTSLACQILTRGSLTGFQPNKILKVPKKKYMFLGELLTYLRTAM